MWDSTPRGDDGGGEGAHGDGGGTLLLPVSGGSGLCSGITELFEETVGSCFDIGAQGLGQEQ